MGLLGQGWAQVSKRTSLGDTAMTVRVLRSLSGYISQHSISQGGPAALSLRTRHTAAQLQGTDTPYGECQIPAFRDSGHTAGHSLQKDAGLSGEGVGLATATQRGPRHRARVSASIFCSPCKFSGSGSWATLCRMAISGPPPYRLFR